MSLSSNRSCSLCKHWNVYLAAMRREPYNGSIPCTSCTRFPDQRTDKFQHADRDKINKMYRDAEGNF